MAAHQGDGLGVAACRVGKLRLCDRQRVVAHDGGNGARPLREDAHGFNHALGRGAAAGGGKRHQPVRQREGGLAVADARLGLVGQFFPALADIDAQALQAKQHGSRVLHVDVNIGRGHRQRPGQVAKACVVEIQRSGRVAVLKLAQRAVPPQMVLQVMCPRPVGGQAW